MIPPLVLNSDSRLKTNIADFTYDLEAFKQYQPKTFDWKNPELHGNKTSQDLTQLHCSRRSSY